MGGKSNAFLESGQLFKVLIAKQNHFFLSSFNME